MKARVLLVIIVLVCVSVVQRLCSGFAGVDNNDMYKEWCEQTFENGKYIYNAYKDVAFNIKYTPEPAETDFWQTPFETTKSRNGDCEDAVFLFFSHLLPDQGNAEIVWGWVIDREGGVAKAHVWYQLTDKEGEGYVVESFSGDWRGIIPMKTINNTEERQPILILSHAEAGRLASMVSKPDSMDTYKLSADLHGSTDFITPVPGNNNIPAKRYARRHFDSESIEFQAMSRTYNTSWSYSIKDRIAAVISKEISKIFEKLHEMFTRYDLQMKTIGLLP